jgi:hypothetical protein
MKALKLVVLLASFHNCMEPPPKSSLVHQHTTLPLVYALHLPGKPIASCTELGSGRVCWTEQVAIGASS